MSISKWFFVIAMAAVLLSSCGKDDFANSKGIVGTWEGKWGFDDEVPSVFEKWEIKKNGEITAFNAASTQIAKGTWKLDGLLFTMVYTPTGKSYTYSFEGLYHDKLKEIIGTWGDTPSASDGGDFEMYKK